MATELNEGLFDFELLLARDKVKASDTLHVGTKRREDVKSLQEILSAGGHELEVDGIYGPRTKSAVTEFQKEHGLQVDGVVGPETLKKLSKVKPEAESKNGSTDPSIDAIRSYVPTGTTKGSSSSASSSSSSSSKTKKGPHGGTIDPKTGKEIASSTTGPIGSTKEGAFGKTASADPLKGREEFEKAHPRNASGEFIQKGDSGQHVSNTQKSLNEQGYNLKVDGQFGPKTEQAVKHFQSENENKKGKPLAVDGIVGFQTAGALLRQANKQKKEK